MTMAGQKNDASDIRMIGPGKGYILTVHRRIMDQGAHIDTSGTHCRGIGRLLLSCIIGIYQ